MEYHFIPERPHVKPRQAKRAPAKKVQPVPNCHDCRILSKEVARLRRRVLALEKIFGSLGQETHLKEASDGRNCHSVINHQVPRIVEQAPKHTVPNSLNASRQALYERVDNRFRTQTLEESRNQIGNHVSPVQRQLSQSRNHAICPVSPNRSPPEQSRGEPLSLSEAMLNPVIDSCTIRNPLPGHDQPSSSDYHSAVYDYNEGFPGNGYLNMGFEGGSNLLCDFDGGDFISAPENGLQGPPGETTARGDGGEFSGQHPASFGYHSVVCDYNVGFPGNADSGLGFGHKSNGDFGSGDFFSSSTYNSQGHSRHETTAGERGGWA
ncbi:hypothetical protein, variant [Blastomyces dermatitidis ATCC 26199]|nr:hypothetical protein, variant [Blastomyces dermatitidis ATCC 26199]